MIAAKFIKFWSSFQLFYKLIYAGVMFILLLLIVTTQLFSIKSDFKQCVLNSRRNIVLVDRDDTLYSTINYQVIVTSIIYPQGYVFVNNAEDVKQVIICATKFNTKLAIQSGGHSLTKLSFGNNESFVLSTVLMNKVEYDKNSRTATVEAGLRAGSLTKILWKLCKCAVPVGNCLDVGITGFALGGGFGMSARTHGLLVDNIIEMEVVTADGVIRHVNQYKNGDLFWALRGAGGGNFGVVTKFTFKTFDANHTYVWINNLYDRRFVNIVFRQWYNYVESNVSSAVTCELVVTRNEFLLWIAIDTNDEKEREAETAKVLKFFPSVASNTIRKGSYIEFYEQLSLKPSNDHIFEKTESFYVTRLLNESDIDKFLNFVQHHNYLSFWAEMYGGAINQISKTETAFVHRNALFNIAFEAVVQKDASNSISEMITLGDTLYHRINHLSDIRFMDSGQTYQNYANDDYKHWTLRYYGDNYRQLQETKFKYDVNNYFTFPQSIVPLKN